MMFAFQQRHSPLHRGVTLDELGGAALYLLSDLSTGVTGEIHFVDSGYNVIAMLHPEALRGDRRDATTGTESSRHSGPSVARAGILTPTPADMDSRLAAPRRPGMTVRASPAAASPRC